MKSLAMAGLLLAVCGAAHAQARAAGQSEIDFFINSYAGDDIALENAGCVRPVIPVVSESKREIERVAREYTAWRDCYNRFVDKLGAQMPLGSALPAEVQRAMTPADLEMAKLRLAKVYAVVAEEGQAEAQLVGASFDAWTEKTNQFVQLENVRLKAKQREIDLMNRDFAEKMDMAPRVLPTRAPGR